MKKEIIASYLFFFFGLYGLVFSLHLPMGKMREPGPGVFPLAISILLCTSGLLWFMVSRNSKQKREKTNWGNFFRNLITPAKIVGLTLGFILTLNRIGFLLSASLYTVSLFLLVSRYKWCVSTVLGLIIGIASWFAFEKFLSVQFPGGFWFQ